MVFSNVPGPPETVVFAGRKIKSVQMIHLNLIPQLGFLSYRGLIFGNICLGVDGENFDMPHRERFPLHFSRAVLLLASQLGIEDVPETLRAHAAMLKDG